MIEMVEVMAHGRPASEALARVVAGAKAGNALGAVTVVVPSNLAGLSARRLLGAGLVSPAAGGPGARGEQAPGVGPVGVGPVGTGIANVSFVTPFRLAELLAADTAGGGRPLTNPVLGAAVRRVLAEAPGAFAPVAGHHATEAALAATFGELSHVSPASLDALERAGGTAAEAVRVHRLVASHLAGYSGEDEVATAATLRDDLASALRPFGHIVWHLPEPTTPALTRLLTRVLDVAPASVIVGLTGAPDADAPVRAVCGRAGVAVPDVAVVAPTAAAIVSVTDADEEVRAVVRHVVALAEAGVPLARIGVFHPTADPYVRTLGQQFVAAGIPCNGPAGERVLDRVAGRSLLAALALPGARWRRDRVMELVSGAPVRHDGEVAASGGWEAVSRRAGVVQDLTDWRSKLARLATHLDDRLGEDGLGVASPVARAVARDRDDALALAAFVEGLAGSVRQVEGALGWAAKSAAALALLHQLVGSPARRSRWPAEEQAAADHVEAALARLGVLDQIEPHPTPEVFGRALSAELDVAGGRSGRFGEGVVHGPLSSAPGQDLDAVFVVGMAEGTCPSPRRDDALLPDAVRALAADGELVARSERLHEQHRALLAALASAPPERRWLVHPRGSLRGERHRLPSRWLLDSASALAGRRVHSTDFAGLGPPVVSVVASYAAGLDGSVALASVEERDLAVVSAHVASGGDPARHPAAAPVADGMTCLAARRSAAFTVWDGNLAGLPVASPATGDVASPTRLERWAACGFRSYLADVLGLEAREEPERTIDLSALDRGTSVHRALEVFFAEVIAGGAPAPDERWTPGQRARLAAIASDVLAEDERAGRTGRPVHWRLTRDQVLTALDGFLDSDERHRRATGSHPVSVELAFGLDGAPPVAVALDDGRTVRFRGRADRVDATAAGRLLVSDYKTGKGEAYKKIDEGDPVRAGTTLQLGLYAEAANQLLGGVDTSSHYWMVNDAARYARHGYQWDDERRARFVEAVTAIVEGIDSGVFAAAPGEWDSWRQSHEQCRFCEFDAVCPVDRGEQAQAKGAAPELAVRVTLGARGERGST